MNELERATTAQAALDAIRQYRTNNPLLDRQKRIAGCIEAARKVWSDAYEKV